MCLLGTLGMGLVLALLGVFLSEVAYDKVLGSASPERLVESVLM